jgi:hypothetical protein
VKVAYGDINECLGMSRIILVSNDHRLGLVRYFDSLLRKTDNSYSLVSNRTLFPAQITVFDRSEIGNLGQIWPARLDLPEQDLRFPLILSDRDWKIDGFMRMDKQTPEIEILGPLTVDNSLWVLTNFRVDHPVALGTPVFSLKFFDKDGNVQKIELKGGEDTSTWDGYCSHCMAITQWKKLVHLVGSFAYSGAYRQYDARVWGKQLEDIKPFTILQVSYLLPDGTGYFWGIYPNK